MSSLWWGYRHVRGTYQAKRYFGQMDIAEARESPFCQQAVGPFNVPDSVKDPREYALKKVKELTQ